MQPDWELWIDANISPIIAKWMADHLTMSVKTAYSLEVLRKDDQEIYALARERGNVILVSKDADFPELVNRLGAPPKVVNIRIGNARSKDLWARLQPALKEIVHILTTSDVQIVEVE